MTVCGRVLAVVFLAGAGCRDNGSNGGGPDGGSSGGSGGDDGMASFDCLPGRVGIRRLNRAEFNNTVLDLLGDATRPADEFPVDGEAHGFDNIAEALTISPLHVQKYSTAAEAMVGRALSDPTQRARIMTCQPDAADPNPCVETIIRTFGLRAWRRPLTETEVVDLAAFVTVATGEGDDTEQGISLALQSMLLSPNFLFRVELDPDPESAAPYALDDYEVASRLSYFLWSSMPDGELFDVAAAGELSTREQIVAHARRMLGDRRAEALVDDFAAQWLHTRSVARTTFDADAFPEWTPELAWAMERETLLLFRSILADGGSATDLLSARHSFLTPQLADHYGVAHPGGSEPVRVDLDGSGRQGLLTHGSILAVTSGATDTSVVRRGKWVMQQLLCDEPPPPPPDVDTDVQFDPNAPRRQQLEAHRANPACSGCHTVMDEIGFGLEGLDPLGRFRTEYAPAVPIDDRGTLPDGRTFAGPQELADIVADDPLFERCVAEQLLVYAIGRGMAQDDACTLDALVDEFAAQDHRFEALIMEIVSSSPFVGRQPEGT